MFSAFSVAFDDAFDIAEPGRGWSKPAMVVEIGGRAVEMSGGGTQAIAGWRSSHGKGRDGRDDDGGDRVAMLDLWF
jgi:hypothetical protein